MEREAVPVGEAEDPCCGTGDGGCGWRARSERGAGGGEGALWDYLISRIGLLWRWSARWERRLHCCPSLTLTPSHRPARRVKAEGEVNCALLLSFLRFAAMFSS